MPVFEIEQYEIHAQKFRVKAKNEAEAIKKLLDGKADPVDDGLDYIEVCEDMGLPVEECPDLADELRSLGVTVGERRQRMSYDLMSGMTTGETARKYKVSAGAISQFRRRFMEHFQEFMAK